MTVTTRPTASPLTSPLSGSLPRPALRPALACRPGVRPPARSGHRATGDRPAGLDPKPGRRSRRARPRVTRRGRLLLVLVIATLLVGAFSIGRASSTASNQTVRTSLEHVVVQPGDTLWVIARRAVPGADPRVTVQRIIDLNGLSGTGVVPGQQLVLPVH